MSDKQTTVIPADVNPDQLDLILEAEGRLNAVVPIINQGIGEHLVEKLDTLPIDKWIAQETKAVQVLKDLPVEEILPVTQSNWHSWILDGLRLVLSHIYKYLSDLIVTIMQKIW
jgi:hypothetical protein